MCFRVRGKRRGSRKSISRFKRSEVTCKKSNEQDHEFEIVSQEKVQAVESVKPVDSSNLKESASDLSVDINQEDCLKPKCHKLNKQSTRTERDSEISQALRIIKESDDHDKREKEAERKERAEVREFEREQREKDRQERREELKMILMLFRRCCESRTRLKFVLRIC